MPHYIDTPLKGQMLDRPLLIQHAIEHADRYHGNTEVVSRTLDGSLHRYTFSDLHRRAKQVANALNTLGIQPGDRIGTLAWNGYRHLELYYGVSGSAAVLHTVNPRLFGAQIQYIIEHAQDQLVFFDLSFTEQVRALAAHCPSVRAFVALCAEDEMPDIPELQERGRLLCYESVLAEASDAYEWPSFDENAASSLCYTSGTTGNPKGVLYSHRSTMLHALAASSADRFALTARDSVAAIVPMFHVNAWGLPYACLMAGAKLVLPGAKLDGQSLYELMEAEAVTFSAGVPTVWNALLSHVGSGNGRFSSLQRVVVGGAACPPAMQRQFREQYQIDVIHAWGMTETSPLATTNALQSRHLALSAQERAAQQDKQGNPLYGIDVKIVNDAGQALARDGVTTGHLMVRGAWVANGYYRSEPSAKDGWFATGDVATLDAHGNVQITDRSKDVIKSGGEWIGSIDLENLAASHPAVLQVACIGVHHSKWDERPLLVVVPKPGVQLEPAELLRYFRGKVVRWWEPDDAVFVEALPIGATGKILKNVLREQFKTYRLPTDRPQESAAV